VLGDEVAAHRLGISTQIIKLLLTMVPEQRNSKVKENGVEYDVKGLLDTEVPF
jgi:hypothetical protein